MGIFESIGGRSSAGGEPVVGNYFLEVLFLGSVLISDFFSSVEDSSSSGI